MQPRQSLGCARVCVCVCVRGSFSVFHCWVFLLLIIMTNCLNGGMFFSFLALKTKERKSRETFAFFLLALRRCIFNFWFAARGRFYDRSSNLIGEKNGKKIFFQVQPCIMLSLINIFIIFSTVFFFSLSLTHSPPVISTMMKSQRKEKTIRILFVDVYSSNLPISTETEQTEWNRRWHRRQMECFIRFHKNLTPNQNSLQEKRRVDELLNNCYEHKSHIGRTCFPYLCNSLKHRSLKVDRIMFSLKRTIHSEAARKTLELSIAIP